MSTRKISAVALTLIVAAVATCANAAESGKAILADGATTATETGHIKGNESADYTFQGHKGQTLHAKLGGAGENDYFDVLPPGEGEPLFIGARVGNEFTGALPADGQYTLRVHLSGQAAYKNQEADYSLAVDLK